MSPIARPLDGRFRKACVRLALRKRTPARLSARPKARTRRPRAQVDRADPLHEQHQPPDHPRIISGEGRCSAVEREVPNQYLAVTDWRERDAMVGVDELFKPLPAFQQINRIVREQQGSMNRP